MDERCCLFLGIILCLALVCESRVIIPRALPIDGSSGNGELPLSTNPLGKDKKSGLKPIIRGPPTRDDDFNAFDGDKRVYHPIGPVLDYDYVGLDRRFDNIPGIIPERLPSPSDPNEWPGTNPEENDDTAPDDNFKKTFGQEHPYRSDNNDKDFESSPDETKPIHNDGDDPKIAEEFDGNNNDKDFKPKNKERPDEEKEENDIPEDEEEKPDEENDIPEDDEEKSDEEEMHKPEDDEAKPDEEMHKPEDDEAKPDEEEEMHKPEDDEAKPDEEEEMHKPKDDEEREEEEKHEIEDDEEKPDEERKEDDDKDEESVNEAEEAELSSGGSIFDNPFFNLEQVKKYFSTLERALGHVFRQTVDEAILLNGTYANTTEEEVEIDGKKYIIMKSVIKGADNHSSLYIESLSSEPKMNGSEIIEDNKITNVTRR